MVQVGPGSQTHDPALTQWTLGPIFEARPGPQLTTKGANEPPQPPRAWPPSPKIPSGPEHQAQSPAHIRVGAAWVGLGHGFFCLARRPTPYMTFHTSAHAPICAALTDVDDCDTSSPNGTTNEAQSASTQP